MKILQINSVCGIGSTGRIATDIHNFLIEQGHKGYIAYGRGLPKGCDSTVKIGTIYDNYMHAVLTRVLDKHGFGSIIATKQLIRKINQINPEVIHLHNIHGYYINIDVLFNYLKTTNKAIVWTLHDCWAFTGHCSHFDYEGCDKWKTECFKCPQKKNYPKSILKDNSKNNYNRKKKLFTSIKNMTIITPSNWLTALVKESFLQKYPIKIISNGINLDDFKPTDSNFRIIHNITNKFIILGVAYHWNERKGFKYFIELSSLLYKDEVIVMVGLSEQQIRDLPYNIIGIIKTNDVFELSCIYSTADVLVNLTLEEVMGLVNVESLACGTPVITFNTGGSIECIDEDCGFIIEKGDLHSLIDSIRKIKQKGKSFYLHHCRERAKCFYDIKDEFNKYINIYNEVSKNKIINGD